MADVSTGVGEAAAQISTGVSEEAERTSRRLWRRRRFVVNRGYQFRVTFFSVAVVLLLLALLNVSLWSATRENTELMERSTAPELAGYFKAQDRLELNLLLIGSIAFLVGVFIIGILETHKTAGASYNICRCIERLQDGEYRIRIRLRRGDNLHEIEKAFNALAQSLFDRTCEEVGTLESMAVRAEELSAEPRAAEMARQLRQLLAERRRLVE